uniref:Ig-like domain-containing protein n=1 Tax=Salmo trutta TaxID=8032 RepID=A0A674F545_SALTR
LPGLLLPQEIYEKDIKPTSGTEHGMEGSSVTLSCNYSGSVDYLQWYRQYPRSAPQFLLYTTVTSKPSKTRVDLEISSVDVIDSALFYCALTPTVTGNPETLYKNLTSPERIFLLCSSRLYLTIVPSSGVNMYPFYCFQEEEKSVTHNM